MTHESFPPLTYSRSYFTQWLLKDTPEHLLWRDRDTPQQSTSTSTLTPTQKKKRNNMELIQLLAINALEFTAPVFRKTTTDQEKLTKKTSTELKLELEREFIQLSGHPGSFAPAGPNSIWKKMPRDSTNEASIYEHLKSTTDLIKSIIPTYISRTTYNDSEFIELEDLVTRFDRKSLNIMDVKLGTRTFLESEVTNTTPRHDLYSKMVKVDPTAPTEEERLTESVTKLRYMQFRERLSSTESLGFRIEGVMGDDRSFQRFKEESEIVKVFEEFARDKKKIFCDKLVEIRAILEQSVFFMSHEIIGSSLLLIHDDEQCGCWLIDFAKTFECGGVGHRGEWHVGNHEDGVLLGMDNLIRLFS